MYAAGRRYRRPESTTRAKSRLSVRYRPIWMQLLIVNSYGGVSDVTVERPEKYVRPLLNYARDEVRAYEALGRSTVAK
jgi:hypothetical protein